jgi:CBS domain-containing protein
MRQWLVDDVMTRKVITAAVDTPIAEVADLLATHRIGAVPIVDDHDYVLGVVSAADLLPKVAGDRPAFGRRAAKAEARLAGQVMTTRLVTIAADASLAEAATTMRKKKVRRLLVTDQAGRLRGVLSRTDVLRPLTRPDAAIRDDVVEHVLRRTLWIEPSQVQVRVDDGVVTLTGAVGRRTTGDIAARLAETVPGAVAVVDRIRHDFDDSTLARSRVGRTHPFSAEPFAARRDRPAA